MIQGKNNLLQWFEMQNKPYFNIFRKNNSENGNIIYTNLSQENETVGTAKSYLDRCLSLISSGDFFIVCFPENKSISKGRSETYFCLTTSDQAAPMAMQTSIAGTGLSQEDVNKLADERFARLMEKKELDETKKLLAEVKKENKELTTALQKPWNKLIGELHPYIGSIAQQLGFSPKPILTPAVSGVEHSHELQDNSEPTPEAVAELNATVNSFCEALAAQYPDEWLNIVKKLTNAIKQDPGKIDMALKFL